MQALTDAAALLAIRGGNGDVLGELYSRNLSAFRALASRNGGTTADGEDLLQETLLAFWKNAQQPDFTLSARIDTYLYAIGRNLWHKDRRKWGRTQLTEDEKLASLPPPSQPAPLGHEDIMPKYLDMLPKNCQQLLHLYYYENWSLERIAAHLNLANAGTAKSRKYQCKCKLAELLKKHMPRDERFND